VRDYVGRPSAADTEQFTLTRDKNITESKPMALTRQRVGRIKDISDPMGGDPPVITWSVPLYLDALENYF
jgi:hypothetical protein